MKRYYSKPRRSVIVGYDGKHLVGAKSEAELLSGSGILLGGTAMIGSLVLRNETISRRRMFARIGLGGLLFCGVSGTTRADFNVGFAKKPSTSDFLLSFDSMVPGKLILVETSDSLESGSWMKAIPRVRTRLHDERKEVDIVRDGAVRFYRISEIGEYDYHNAWLKISDSPLAYIPYNAKQGFFYNGRNDGEEYICGGAHDGYVIDSEGYHIVGGMYAGPPLVDPDGTLVFGGAYAAAATVTQPDGAIHCSGNNASSYTNPDGYKVLGGESADLETNPDGSFAIGGAYSSGLSSFAENPDGTFIVGWNYTYIKFNPNGHYSVGGQYTSSRYNADGSYTLGGNFTIFRTGGHESIGKVYCGASYDEHQSGTDGKVAVGGLYDGCQPNP